MENKRCRCRCRLFSCFACFSDENTTPPRAQPDPSENAPLTSTAAQPDPSENAPVASTAAPNAAQPDSSENALLTSITDDALTHPHHGPQTFVPPAASTSSEAGTSTDVLTELNHPQPILHPDLCSSSQPSTSPVAFPFLQVAEPSSSNAATNNQLQGTPSPSDLTNNILASADAVDTEDVDADINPLMEYISHLLEVIKEKNKGNKPAKTEGAKISWQSSSESLKKFREVLSETINVIKDIIPGEAKTVIQGLLKGMGAAHLTCTGLLIAAHVLERIETVSANRDKCLLVLDEICNLAQHVKKLRQRDGFRKGMEDSIKEAMGLIVEASIMCSNQIGSSKGWRFLTASRNKEELENFRQRLETMYRQMDNEMPICFYDTIEKVENLQQRSNEILSCIYDATKCRQVRPQKPRERPYPDYAVGIEKPLEKVKELLEWESEKNAVAVILHGFGGMGKTTLADAVFARVYVEGCKYSMVRLFDDVTSKPSTSDIVKLQKYILEDLEMGTPEEITHKIRTVEEGQREIGRILQKEKAFIYVDNVLERYPFEQLLPRDMDKAQKLRLLITTRDTDVSKECWKLKTKIYAMKGLPLTEGKSLLEKELYTSDTYNMEKQLSSAQLDEIVEMCGYIPQLLRVVAKFISWEKDPQRAYLRVKEERERNWKGEIGKDIAHYIFAYQTLDEGLKDPFLDICSFFNGWKWSDVANIVGDDELNSLEKRALVTKKTKTQTVYDYKKETVWVHDVILAMGDQQAEGTRFTSADQIGEFLDEKEEDIRKIKGIMLQRGKADLRPVCISASKLDLMCSSLRVFRIKMYGKVEGTCEKKFEKLVYVGDKVSDLPFDVSRSKELKYLDVSEDQGLTDSKLEKLLGSISKFPYFTVLKLKYCNNLRQLPKNIGSLKFLQNLCLENCLSLEALPSSLGDLSSLRLLDLSGCRRLKDLPYAIGKLTALANLRLAGCQQLSSIPESIGQLKSLESSINLCSTGLKELPDGFCNLSFITHLVMEGCDRLEKLPCRFGEVTSLKHLSLRTCVRLKKLPESFGQLKYVEHLDLSECTILEELCINFSCFSSLRFLKLDRCKMLKKLSLGNCKHLEKLPESFGQLKYLEHLDLSECMILEELCINSSCLSSLRFLKLDRCKMLKKLPEDFHCLASLNDLRLRDCHMLEGKWMESMLKMKTLQHVVITGSPLLEQRWEEIQRQGDESWSFDLYTGRQFSSESKEHIFKQLHSKFDSILTNGRVSDLPLNTLLLVIFDGCQEFSYDFPSSLIEENIDDIQAKFKMIYFGNHFNKLPKKMTDRILCHAPANSDANALFRKVFAANADNFKSSDRFQMSAKIVSDEKGDKYLSGWKKLSKASVEKFVIKKCGRYLKLKSNRELLRELFASGEEEGTLSFLKKDASKELRLHELEGKTILLDIRGAKMYDDDDANDDAKMMTRLPLQSLVEMYVAEKERLNFEIITIPMMKHGTESDISDQFSREVPWLVLQNPGKLKSVIKFFLVEDCAEWLGEQQIWEWDKWQPGTMRVIERDGTIAGHNPAVLRMVNTWGAKAYPFTEEKRVELEEEERKQMKAMSNLEFLFNHLESRLRNQVKEVMFKGKMICLYSCSTKRLTGIELSDNVHMIYIPQFIKFTWGFHYFTEGIRARQIECRKPEMPETQGMSVLSEQEAVRFWARIYSLKECINGMDDNDKQLDGIKKLLYFIQQVSLMMTTKATIEKLFSRMPMPNAFVGIIDEDGELVTTLGRRETIEKSKELIEQLMNCPKERRKEMFVE